MSEQLVFELPHRPALGADDFLVSDCNVTAVRLIDTWPDWPNRVHAIVGPPGCGKSHLANVWRLKSRAGLIAPGSIRTAALEALVSASAIVLEDADRAMPQGLDENAFFHLLNLCKEKEVSLLLTGRTLPRDWSVALPDLASRLRSIPLVSIGAPDDDLLRAVLVKHFTDRQLQVAPDVISYLTARMERSMDAAGALVGTLDRAALAAGRKITRQFAGQVLENMGGAEPGC